MSSSIESFSPVPITALVDLSTHLGCDDPKPEIVQRVVTSHPLFPDASIETVWEVYSSSRSTTSELAKDDDTRWMRIAIYSGPDTSPRTLHASFELHSDADPQQVSPEDTLHKLLSWTTFPEQPQHPVLCVLVQPTSLCLWDPYPSSDEPDTDSSRLSLPEEGWTITLPFECSSVLAVHGRGLFLQRLEYAEDSSSSRPEDNNDDGFVLKSPPTNRNYHSNNNNTAAIPLPHSMPAVPALFSLEHPLEDILPVCELVSSSNNKNAADANNNNTSSFATPARPIVDVHEKLLWMGPVMIHDAQQQEPQVLVLTYHTQTRRHALWAVQQAPPPPRQMPLYQQTRLSHQHSNVLTLLEDLDLMGLDTAAATSTTTTLPPASRQEALADALGVRRTTPRRESRGPEPFVSPNRSMIMATTAAAPTSSPWSSSPLHASLALQCLYRSPASSSVAQNVFVASSSGGTTPVLLCLHVGQALQFWSLECSADDDGGWQVTPHPAHTVTNCIGALPIQCLPDKTDILVHHTNKNRLTLYRAWEPVVDYALPEHVVERIEDPVGDRITLHLPRNKTLRGKLSLCISADRILASVDAAAGEEWAILALCLRADVCRLGGNDSSAVQAVLMRLFEVAWYGQQKPTTEAAEAKATDAWDSLLESDYHGLFSAANGDEIFTNEVSSGGQVWEDDVSRQESELTRIRSLSEDYIAGKDMSIFVPRLFDHLHLLYEDLKLSVSSGGSGTLGKLLARLCLSFPNQNDVTVQRYLDYYRHDLGNVPPRLSRLTFLSENRAPTTRLSFHPFPPSLLSWCETIMKEGSNENNDWQAEDSAACPKTSAVVSIMKTIFATDTANRDELVVEALLKEGFVDVASVRERLPVCIALPIFEVLSRCRNNDASLAGLPNWSADAWSLVGREDLSMNVSKQLADDHAAANSGSEFKLDEKDFVDNDQDGLAPLEKSSALLFPSDNRIREAARLLRTSRPMFLRVARAVEVSDHDYERLKQKRLLFLSRRALALPIGRGMLTIASLHPVPAEPMPIPDLCLKGRVPPTNASISLDMSDCPADMRVWPEFHNGVCAGLRLPVEEACGSFEISRTWIVYNRPPSVNQNSSEDGDEAANTELLFKNHSHGGLLLALGLRGHLNALEMSDLYEYLTQGTVTTTVGILLGMAANKRGSCDIAVSKMLCLHIPSLIPQHFSAIDVASTVQAAAVIGSGLLFEGSSHRMMTEFLLNEIGRRPESDASTFDRESYTLACGLALGMVNLCISERQESGIDRAAGVADLRIEERLQKYVLGGIDSEERGRTREANDRFSMPLSSSNGDSEKCSTIYEGDLINTEVTAPGATLALGLMYLKSENQTIASSLALPDTHFLLEFVRPDLLTLRLVARSLILWDEVLPSLEWIESQVPTVVRKAYTQMGAMAKRASQGLPPLPKDREDMEFDRRAVRQIYVHTVAGACFGMGLRFAGTGNQKAKEAIQYFMLELYALRESNDPVAAASKPELPILETCLGCVAISLAMVMAGTGDLDALRILKMLRWRCDDEARYGFHMICGMAIGLLFLGGGSCTLGRDPSDIAALVVAFFPRFPLNTSDNQNHLQALRHLYALAVKRRELRAVDVDSEATVRVPVELWSEDQEPERIVLPCLLRNSEKLRKELRIVCGDYYPLRLRMDNLVHRGVVFVKKRLSSIDRPYLKPYNGQKEGSVFTLTTPTPDGLGTMHPLVQLVASTDRAVDSTLGAWLDGLGQDLGVEILSVLLSLCQPSLNIDFLWNLRLIRTYFENRAKHGIRCPSRADASIHALLAYLLESTERDLANEKDPTGLKLFAFYGKSMN